MLRKLSLAFSLMATPVLAESPKVVTDIPPVHSLVAAIMNDVGAPHLLLRESGSPHDLALRPSDAGRVQDADLVFWVGPALSPQLQKVMDSLAAGRAITLLTEETEGLLEMREGAQFGAADHDDHESHDGTKHDDDEHQHDHEEHDAAHADDDHDSEEHRNEQHADHDDDHHHDHDGPDPHAWLSPQIAADWAQQIATRLSALDPANAAIYEENLASLVQSIEDAANDARASVSGRGGVLMMHDSIQYFEKAMGLKAVGAVSDGHDATPGAERLAELRDMVSDGSVTCVLVEAGTSTKTIGSIDPDNRLTVVEIDQLGLSLEPGAGLYPALLRGLGDAWATCP